MRAKILIFDGRFLLCFKNYDSKHQDFAAFTGNNFGAITEKNATIYDGKISNSRSFGYNLRYTPKVGCIAPLKIYKLNR
jgi:hypothetical protein